MDAVEEPRIKRAIWACGLARILLIPCVITSQPLARHRGGSRARADSLRTPKCSSESTCRLIRQDSASGSPSLGHQHRRPSDRGGTALCELLVGGSLKGMRRRRPPSPPEVDEEPSAVESLALRKDDGGYDAGTKQHQDGGAENSDTKASNRVLCTIRSFH
jgi:hypothetical protein